MRNLKLTTLAAGVALATGLLAGCGSSPPEERVAVVPPVIVTPPATASSTQSFRGTLGMTPMQSASGVVRLQSFAGDVCITDNSGNANVSHCVCEQSNCTCRTTTDTCNP